VEWLVQVRLARGQFDALAFNLSSARLSSSTLRQLLHAGEHDAAATELFKWDHADEKGIQWLREKGGKRRI